MQSDIKYTIIIPSAGGQKLHECLNSMDAEIRKNVIVYRNAPGIEVEDIELAGGGVNDGVSTAWNHGRKHVIDNQQDYLIILSQNVTFNQGGRDFIKELNEQRPRYGASSNLSWHWFAISRETLEELGEFDTNYYPIYYEDGDYAIRMHLRGMLDHIGEIKVDAQTPSGYSTTLGMRPDTEPLKQYMIDKWGEIIDWGNYPNQKFFEHPFNNPDNDIGYFEKKTTEELMKQYGYDKRNYDLYIQQTRNSL